MSIYFSFLPSFSAKLTHKPGNCSFGIYFVHWLAYLTLKNNGFILHGRSLVDPVINTIIVFLISFTLIFVARFFKPLGYLC